MSGVVDVVCPKFCRWWKTGKHSCRSSVISMRSYPPQHPRSSNPLNPSPPSFFFFPLHPPTLSLSFPLLFIFFPRFLCCPFPFLFFSFFPDPPLFNFFLFPFPFFSKLFLLFFLVCVCVYLRVKVRAYLVIPCVSANGSIKHIKLNIRYVFYKKINKMK